MYNFPLNVLNQTKYTETLSKKMISHFTEFWRNSLSNSSKLTLYSKIKTKYEPEHYLNVIRNEKLKKELSKLRVSNHILMIEQGRYQNPKLPRELRLCPICLENGNKNVEDEFHFLCDCPAYKSLRENFFQNLDHKIHFDMSSLQLDDKIFNILNPDLTDCHQEIALYVYSCMKLRSTLVT